MEPFPSTVSVSLSFSVCGLLTTHTNDSMVTLLSVGNLGTRKCDFSSTCKNWPVCGYGRSVWWTLCFWLMPRAAIKCGWRVMTCDDLMTSDVHPNTSVALQNVFFSLQIRKHKPPCVLHPIIDLKCKSHKSSLPLWTAAPCTHPQAPRQLCQDSPVSN